MTRPLLLRSTPISTADRTTTSGRDGRGTVGDGFDESSSESSVGLRRRHLPALDGMRAVAVCAVMAYHLQFGWAGGGYLGVDVFFVLSGFLITGLLTEEHASSGGISLGRFWLRRARRLLPGLVVVLGAISVCTAIGNSAINKTTLPGDMVGTLFYFANWHFIAGHSSYFAQFLVPSPLEHTWSLAIEEQFYVVWPLLLFALMRLGRRSWRHAAMLATALLASASVVDMALVTRGAGDITRAYFGTDTRVFELMVGALLALWLERGASVGVGRRWVGPVGWTAMAGLFAAFGFLGGPPHWMFDGGFLGVALVTALILGIAAKDRPGSLGATLSLGPLRWIGKISYGLYLWHWPIYVLLSTSTTPLASWAVDLLRVTLTFVAAAISYYVVEEPIRRGSFSAVRRSIAAVPVASCLVVAVVAVLVIAPNAAIGASPLPGTRVTGTPVFRLGTAPTPRRPLRVLLIGDSVMQFAAPGIEAALEATGVITTDSIVYPGWGLTTDHTWRKSFADAIKKYEPDVVMGTWSWDKQEALAHPAAYTRLFDDAMNALRAPGNGVQGVVLFQFPVVGAVDRVTAPSRVVANRQIRRWNAIVASEAGRHPSWLGYLPVAGSLELEGKYSTWLPTTPGHWVRARTTDQFHLCPAGVSRYADAVLTDLEAWWSLPKPTSKWWKAPWASNPFYDRYGRCPNDGPGGA